MQDAVKKLRVLLTRFCYCDFLFCFGSAVQKSRLNGETKCLQTRFCFLHLAAGHIILTKLSSPNNYQDSVVLRTSTPSQVLSLWLIKSVHKLTGTSCTNQSHERVNCPVLTGATRHRGQKQAITVSNHNWDRIKNFHFTLDEYHKVEHSKHNTVWRQHCTH